MEYNHILKYIFINLCGMFIFSKLVNEKTSVNTKLLWIPLSFLSSFLALTMKACIPPLNIFVIYCTILISGLVVHKKTLSFTIVTSLISFGICYLLYVVAFFITIPIAYINYYTINELFWKDLITELIISFNQIILTFILFRIKRFKSGLITFENKLSNDLSVIISILVLFFASLIYIRNDDDVSTVIIFALVFIGLLLYFYFRNFVTNKYLNKVHIRNNEILEVALEQERIKVENLTVINQDLSKIIHRDNKLIPSMLIAVEDILNTQSIEEQKKKSLELLPQVKTMAEERSDILCKFHSENIKLPSTGLISLNSAFRYLLKKASKDNINFDLSVTADSDILTTIDENDLNTLILDLVENAIIATVDTNPKNILVILGIDNHNFYVSIYDSGTHFNPHVIKNLGLKRITTHKKSGGSGIGLMTTFDIIKKYSASFIINELVENESFTKEVRLSFDNRSDVQIISNRKEIKSIISKRKSIIS